MPSAQHEQSLPHWDRQPIQHRLRFSGLYLNGHKQRMVTINQQCMHSTQPPTSATVATKCSKQRQLVTGAAPAERVRTSQQDKGSLHNWVMQQMPDWPLLLHNQQSPSATLHGA